MKDPDWDRVAMALLKERDRMTELLIAPSLDHPASQFLRGRIDALAWALDLPRRQEEEEEFERQREQLT